MIKRLINFYNNSSPDSAESCMSQIWEGITRVYHKGLMDALKSGDEQRVERELDTFIVSGGSHGMEHLPHVYTIPDPTLDRSRLANAELGVPDPATGMVYSVSGSVALLVHQLAGGVPRNVLEIGGGLGFIGVIMSRWGATSYTDIDIPTNAVAAAYFFSRCCGEHRVFLCGEADAPMPANYYRFAHYHPASNFAELKTRGYDVIVNVNSFPEIPDAMQDQYLRLIADCLSHKGFFLSINHENAVLGQRSLESAMRSSTTGLFRVTKQPCSFLTGYVEEVYRTDA